MRNRALVILAVLLLSCLSLATVNDYYVSNSGSDAAAGDISHPWQTIQKCVNTFTLGSTGAVCHVGAGTYTQVTQGSCAVPGVACVNRGGSSSSIRLKIQCDSALHCLIRNGSSAFIVDGASNLDIAGFDIGNSPSGLWAVGVIYEGSATLSTSGNSVHVLNNYIHDIGQTTGGAFGPGCPDVGIIQGNNQHGHYITDFQAIGNRLNNIYSTGTCSDGHRHGPGIYTISIGAIIENNVISNTNNMGIQVSDNGCQSVISNNTVFNTRASGIVLNGTGVCSNPGNNTINNNIVANVAGTGFFAGSGICNGSHLNLWSNNNAYGSGVANFSGQTSCDTVSNSHSENPTSSFINYQANGSGDYHLKSTSTLIDVGTTSCVSGGTSPCTPSTDFDLRSRPQGSTIDIGAYEFSSSSSPPPNTACVVRLSTSPIAFGNQPVGVLSSAITETVTNIGTASCVFGTITKSGTNSGDFSIVSDAVSGQTLAVNISATFGVKVTAGATGSRTATISIPSNAAASPSTVSATATGTTVAISPTTISFGSQLAGTTGSTSNLTITNNSGSTITVSAKSVVGPFTETDSTCGAISFTLADTASCVRHIAFSPVTSGAHTGSVTYTTTGGNVTTMLSGTGTSSASSLAAASGTGSYGNVPVGSSVTKNFTLANNGSASLTSIASTLTTPGGQCSDYSKTTTCGSSLAAHSSCTISVTSHPTDIGTRACTLSVASDDASSPNLVSLTTNGTASTGVNASTSPTSLTFAPQQTTTTSPTQSVTITNNSGSSISITSVTSSNAVFTAAAGTCTSFPHSLSASASCAPTVSFSPTAVGVVNANLVIVTSVNTITLPMTGTGTSSAASLTPSTWNFGNVASGGTSSKIFTLFNGGTASLTSISTSLTTPGGQCSEYSKVTSCGASLAAGASCTVTVSANPTSTGSKACTLSISDSDASSPQTASLLATGVTVVSSGGGDKPLYSQNVKWWYGVEGETSPVVNSLPFVIDASNGGKISWKQINGGSDCGDSTHALSFTASTHLFGCQAISSGGTPGGSSGDIQYNNSSSFGGFADGTIDQVLHGTKVFKSVPSCADSGGNHLNYDTSTHAWSCGTSVPSSITVVRRMLIEYAGCNAGTAYPAWNLPSSSAMGVACTADNQEGNLTAADAQIAYYDLIIPDDFSSFNKATINFTTTDTTNGHTIIWNLATKCVQPNNNVANLNAPTYNTAGTVTVTIGGSATSGGVYQGTISSLTMTGCSAGYKMRLKLSRATDTDTDTAVQLTDGLLFAYNGSQN